MDSHVSLAPEIAASLRSEAQVPESGSVEVFNYGRGREGLIPLWVGEGDLPTPGFICEAANRSLQRGETFYTDQRGLLELRQALARYHARTFGRPFATDRFYVTGGGMQAIQIAARMICGVGDEVVIPAPLWPNFAAAITISGATARQVPMQFGNAGWTLDLDRIFDAVGDKTRAIFINSPCNPTGWTATEAELLAVVEIARRRGLWVLCDEVYHRFYYDGRRAPSFHDVAEPEDRILYINTFSKNWAMTGWRIGWLTAPPELGQVIENLVQYSTSGVAAFTQRAAIAVLDGGDDFIDYQVGRAREGRDIICAGLTATGRVRLAEPAGAFYLFFSIDGEADTRRLALRIVDETNVGLAPGTAFGNGGAAFMRACFARGAAQMQEATDRLGAWLKR